VVYLDLGICVDAEHAGGGAGAGVLEVPPLAQLVVVRLYASLEQLGLGYVLRTVLEV